MDCSPPGSSVHGLLQARILEWLAMPSSKGSSPPRDRTHVSCGYCIAGEFFTTEPPGETLNTIHRFFFFFFFNLFLIFISCFPPQNITFMRTQTYCCFGHCFLHFLGPRTVPGSKEVHGKYSLSKGSLMCEWVSLVWQYKTGEMATITFLLFHLFLPWSRRDLHPTFLPPSCPFLPWIRNKDTCIKTHI